MEDCECWKKRVKEMGWKEKIPQEVIFAIEALVERFKITDYPINNNQIACVTFAALKLRDKKNRTDRIVLEIPTGKGKSRVLFGIMCALSTLKDEKGKI